MNDTSKNNVIELTQEIEVIFQKAKSILEEITKNTEIPKRVQYRITISFLSMLITEAGFELYPTFQRSELNSMLKRIHSCISEITERDEDQGEDIEGEDAEKLSKALAGMAEDLMNGNSKVKVSKFCME